MADDTKTLSLTCALLELLLAHPERNDSSEGIARWWFTEEMDVVVIERVLCWMKDEQLIEAVLAADGRVRWRRKASLQRLQERLLQLGCGRRSAPEGPWLF
ncbi:MAG: hypothetical protein MUF16_18685 [Burkholderiaceae bacterium]|jgi:hypothetical protein|nr:hypothetical protein [Burkholderiaceae bacterium]